MKQPKPKVKTARHAGSCYRCGLMIITGDKIRIITDNTFNPPITKACHKDCY